MRFVFGAVMNKLVVFDIDGTLTQTNNVDGTCFEAALSMEFGIDEIENDWSKYLHTTDSFILEQVYEQQFGRKVNPEEKVRFQRRFLSLLEKEHVNNPHRFHEIPGAKTAIEDLVEDKTWTVAVGTGGWNISALFKLKCAGICIDSVPSAFADDGFSREEIVQTAIRRALHVSNSAAFTSIVYVGDGVWDATTCRNLAIPFIGIATGEKIKRLEFEGALATFTDFKDLKLFKNELLAASMSL